MNMFSRCSEGQNTYKNAGSDGQAYEASETNTNSIQNWTTGHWLLSNKEVVYNLSTAQDSFVSYL